MRLGWWLGCGMSCGGRARLRLSQQLPATSVSCCRLAVSGRRGMMQKDKTLGSQTRSYIQRVAWRNRCPLHVKAAGQGQLVRTLPRRCKRARRCGRSGQLHELVPPRQLRRLHSHTVSSEVACLSSRGSEHAVSWLAQHAAGGAVCESIVAPAPTGWAWPTALPSRCRRQ